MTNKERKELSRIRNKPWAKRTSAERRRGMQLAMQERREREALNPLYAEKKK